MDVGDLAELNIEPMLRVLLRKSDKNTVAKAIGAGTISHVKLCSEIAAHGHEGVQCIPIAPDPGSKTGDKQHAAQRCRANGLCRLCRAEQSPDAARGQKEQHCGIRECDTRPEQREQEPSLKALS